MAEKFTYFVSGRVYARLVGTTGAFDWPGLVDTIDLAIAETVVNLPDRTGPAGGNYDQVRRIDTVSLSLNHRELDPTTLSRALFGDVTAVAGAAVVDEEHTASPGKFVPLDHPGEYTSVTITDGDSSDPQTIPAADYEVRGSGIWINEDATVVTAGSTISVSYTHPDYKRIQALTGSAPELEIFFDGINAARDELPVPARFYKVRLGAAAALSLLSGDDFGALSLTGEVLKDTSKGTGLSQYFYTDVVIPAAS